MVLHNLKIAKEQATPKYLVNEPSNSCIAPIKHLPRHIHKFATILIFFWTPFWVKGAFPPCPEKGVWTNWIGSNKSDDGTKYVGEWKADEV